jgi:hypothetical protein
MKGYGEFNDWIVKLKGNGRWTHTVPRIFCNKWRIKNRNPVTGLKKLIEE